MNWVTTNIRLPEDLYMELKMRAARERKSVGEIIRNSLTGNNRTNVKDILRKANILGKRIAKEHPGLNLAKAIREMRDEQ